MPSSCSRIWNSKQAQYVALFVSMSKAPGQHFRMQVWRWNNTTVLIEFRIGKEDVKNVWNFFYWTDCNRVRTATFISPCKERTA